MHESSEAQMSNDFAIRLRPTARILCYLDKYVQYEQLLNSNVLPPSALPPHTLAPQLFSFSHLNEYQDVDPIFSLLP